MPPPFVGLAIDGTVNKPDYGASTKGNAEMKITRRELFNLTRENDTPDHVVNLSGAAGDNAADVVGLANRYDARGQFTDAFVDAWFNSVIDRLSTSDMHTPADAAWFKAHGVEA